MSKRELNKKNIQKDRKFSESKTRNVIEEREDIIAGRNAVMEVIKGNRTIEALYITTGQTEGSINAIKKLAREKK